MSRTTTILALIQTLLIVVGFIALGCVLKVSGYAHPDIHPILRWNPLAVFLREHGAWLLLLPVCWVLFATYARRVEHHGSISYRLACIIGVCLAIITTALFLYASVRPYTRPFLYFG